MKPNKLGNNPTTLSLLKAGCAIHFPSGYKMIPDVKTKMILLQTPIGLNDGWQNLNKQGLTASFVWMRKYFRHVTHV